MRTTVNIDDRLLELAKKRAHEQHTTLGAVVTEALQRHLAAMPEASGPPIPFIVGGRGFRPGVDWSSTRALYELMDEDDLGA